MSDQAAQDAIAILTASENDVSVSKLMAPWDYIRVVRASLCLAAWTMALAEEYCPTIGITPHEWLRTLALGIADGTYESEAI